MQKSIPIFIIISTIVAGIFLLFPQIDIAVSGLFYNEQERFFLDGGVTGFIHNSVSFVAVGVGSLWIGLLLYSFIKKQNLWGISRRKLIYLLLALLIGPGLVVNTVFKDNWGRARPRVVQQFGGEKEFTPPFIMTNQCEKNCSFVSGDPSVGFYFFALALAFPARRKLFTAVAFSLGGIYGATRVIQGAHFFSDVIFSGVFTFATCYLLYLLLVKKENLSMGVIDEKHN
jgi:lipid A 4'-phosphatase